MFTSCWILKLFQHFIHFPVRFLLISPPLPGWEKYQDSLLFVSEKRIWLCNNLESKNVNKREINS